MKVGGANRIRLRKVFGLLEKTQENKKALANLPSQKWDNRDKPKNTRSNALLLSDAKTLH